ncbi:hypothetical protein CRENBAI_023515 [Crenichthys baileyi]|uniref:Uncharacterized protein n=1 Tax=Crenichthys baileyi TaxID=28760 RepID=A0AAV9RWE9_9TELE
MVWAEQRRAWEMRAYLPQPLRKLAGKPPPLKPKRRKVLRADISFSGRRARASLPDQSAQPGAQAENGAEPLHIPSAPAAEERAEPPGRSADVSSPPPSAAGTIGPWRSPTYCPRVPLLADSFCYGLCYGGTQNADKQAA